MVTQYPHYLYALRTAPSTQDDQGYWTDESSELVFVSMCREETDGRGSEIKTAGGAFHRFSSLIQLPEGAPRLEIGTTIIVSDKFAGFCTCALSSVRIKGQVLKFDEGQLHSRLWV